MLRDILMAGTALGLTIAMAAPAIAQTPTKNDPNVAQVVDQGAGLDVVVVTATRRETKLQETPISISVMSMSTIENKHVQSLLDLGDGSIPGLRVATFEARATALTVGIRGIVPLDANQPAREQGVGIYVDGVYLGRQHGLNAAMMDLERVEVLKGPQGTLFGRNTEGGAVNMIIKGPTGEFGARMTAGIANYDGYNAALHLDLPRWGALAVKLDAAAQYQGPTLKNPLPGATGFNFFDRRGMRLAFRLDPSDDFRADYAYDVGYDASSPQYSQLVNFNPNGLPIGPLSATLPAGTIRPLPRIVQVRGGRMDVADIGVPQQPSVNDTSGHTLKLSYNVNDDLELKSISAYRTVASSQWDNVGGAHRLPVFKPDSAFSRYSLSELKQNQWSQEFQAVGTWDNIQYVGGFYYFQEEVSEEAATPSTNTWNATGTAYTIQDPGPSIIGRRLLDRGSVAHAESWAVYGQGTWTPSIWDDAFHLTVGGRVTSDDKYGNLYVVSGARTNLPFATKTTRFDPMVTAAFDITEDINAYAKFATGYRAGGANSRSLTNRAFNQEEVDSYEIGLKSEWFDNRLRVNAAAYTMTRTGSQVEFTLVTPQSNGSTRNTVETINAPGDTDIKGLELEGTLRLTDELTMTAAYAYTYTYIPPTRNPFSGTVQPVFIVFTPESAANIAFDYTRPMEGFTIKAHIDGSYSDPMRSFDQFALLTDSSYIVNARISVADIEIGSMGHFNFALWSRNLLNEDYIYRRDPSNRATLGDYANFNTPRTFGAEVSAEF